jgi:hypothetical protein
MAALEAGLSANSGLTPRLSHLQLEGRIVDTVYVFNKREKLGNFDSFFSQFANAFAGTDDSSADASGAVRIERVLAAPDSSAPKPKGRAKRAAERDGDLDGEQQRKKPKRPSKRKRRPSDNADGEIDMLHQGEETVQIVKKKKKVLKKKKTYVDDNTDDDAGDKEARENLEADEV